ncbi:hypothetical protein D3C85_1695430 [compost metagenome]
MVYVNPRTNHTFRQTGGVAEQFRQSPLEQPERTSDVRADPGVERLLSSHPRPAVDASGQPVGGTRDQVELVKALDLHVC